MGVSKHAKVCHFCREEGTRFVHLRSDRPDDPPSGFPRHLCAEHYAVLDAAGERGRVHGPTGLRWWLVRLAGR